MSKARTRKINIITCLLIIVFLLFYGTFIGFNTIYNEEKNKLIENNIESNDRSHLYNESVNFQKYIYRNEKSNIQYQELNSNLLNFKGNDFEIYMDGILDNSYSTRTIRTIYDFDLKINKTSITYSDLYPWRYPGGPLYILAGEIGKPTYITVEIINNGIQFVSDEKNAILTVSLKDYFGYSTWEQTEFIGNILPSEKLKLNFTWIPTYSNLFNLTCNLSLQNDQNLSNNNLQVYNLFSKKWADNFEDGDIKGWSGNIGSDAWHLTDSIQNDPNTKVHTSPFALYHGNETSSNDNYGEKEYLELISPEIDLRRFKKNSHTFKNPTFLNFKFYGESSENKDKFSIAIKSIKEKEWTILNREYSGETLNNSELPEWKIWIDPPFIGIPLHEYVGEIIQFNIRWESDQIYEDKIGFYLDDFYIYGLERPIPDIDIGIDDVRIVFDNAFGIVKEEFIIQANITNYGLTDLEDIKFNIEIKDLSDQHIPNFSPKKVIVNKLSPGESNTISWKVFPPISGIYIVNISHDSELDMFKGNDFIDQTTVEVFEYYNSFEDKFELNNWLPEPGWIQKEISDDLFQKQHSGTKAWFIDSNSINRSIQGNMSILYSPIIDFEGAQINKHYQGDQVNIGFKWYGRGTSEDSLYFEYSINQTREWNQINLPGTPEGYITGNATDRWYSCEYLGTPNLFGNDVQFRWRFKSLRENGEGTGYYIDDFMVWVVQEQFGRPEIKDCLVKPRTIINDSYDTVEISCIVIEGSSPISEVFINLEPLAGPNKILLEKADSSLNEIEPIGQKYDISISVPPSVPKGTYVMKLTAVDSEDLSDNYFVKIFVKENTPPEISKFTPSNSSIEVFENDGIEFSIDAYDEEDGFNLNYEWYLNSTRITNIDNDYYIFNTNYHHNYSSGSYALKVIVSDNGKPKKTVQIQWNIEVLEVLPDFEIRKKEVELWSNNVTVNEFVKIELPIHNLGPPTEKNLTVHLIQQSTNISIGDSFYKKYFINTLYGNSFEFITLDWVANKSFQYLKIWVDPENKILEVSEDNNYIIIPINVSQPPLPNTIPSRDNQTSRPQTYSLLTIVTTGIIITIITLFIYFSTEFGSYKFFLMMAPLYSRVTGNKILEHRLRSKIYSYIKAHPGDHYRSIMAKLKIKNGTLVHHLSRLEQEDLIKSERDGYYKRFYPVGMRIPKSDVGIYYPEGVATYNIGEHQVSAIQLRIIHTIKEHPGLTQKEIAQRIKESRRVVNYHVKLLEQHNLIKIIKTGRETQCYVRDKYSEISG